MTRAHILSCVVLSALAAAQTIRAESPDPIQYQQTAAAGTNAPEERVILTPKPGPQPAIHGAKVYGARPGHPFMYTIPATGDRPMTFSANGLPTGLSVDPKTGFISGQMTKPGEYNVTLQAKNGVGTTERALKIVCGPTIELTPALGWNSWNCFGASVTAEKIKQAADAMVKSGLINHGWSYINIDDYWEKNTRRTNDASLGGIGRDEQGNIVPNPRFPDMKGLVDYIHGIGLKAGIYSGPGPITCGGCVASWQHEYQDAQQYGAWGFDYLKYDWCSYSDVQFGTNEPPQRGRGARRGMPPLPILKKPYEVMRASLDKVPRDIIYSLCQYGWGNVWEWGADVGGNSWRTSGDITDNWRSLSANGFALGGHDKYVGPGHFDDPDMLVIGVVDVGRGTRLHPSNLTPNEQYTHISLWCLLGSPMLIGCDMTQFDDFTLNLLENDEVLDVNQDPLCRQANPIGLAEAPAATGTNTVRAARRVIPQLTVWAKPLADGSKAVGLFNRSDEAAVVTAKWSDLGINGSQTVRDLWRQKDIGVFEGDFHTEVPRHGVVLVKISPK